MVHPGVRRRRGFLFAAGALFAVPLVSAQAPKVRRIGILTALALPTPPEKHSDFGAFVEGMSELGYVNGKSVTYEWRTADGDFSKLPSLASELVSAKVEVIVAQGTPGARAARQATRTIPIVFIGLGDPVGTGIVASLGIPGGNATGVANLSVELDGKRVEMLLDAIPRIAKVAVLLNPGNPTYPLHVKAFSDAAGKRSLQVLIVRATNASDIERGFDTLRRERVDALIVQVDTLFQERRGQIAIFAAGARLPTMFGGSDFVDAGGLMSYSNRRADMYRRAASYVDRIFRGANPASLPVEQPSRFELVINNRTAKAIGVAIPPSILARAERVID